MNQRSEQRPASPCAACGETSRRGWLGALGAALAVLLAPRAALARTLAIRLDRIRALHHVGGFVVLRVKGREILFVRDALDSVRAVHAICPHKKKVRLGYDSRKRLLICSNHGSLFTLEGRVVKGPAQQNLAPIYWTRFEREKNRVLLRL